MGFRPLKPEYTAWARRRRLLRWAGALMLLVVAGAVALDHLGYFGCGGDDWRRFDGRSFPISGVIDGQTFVVCAEDREEIVELVGVNIAATSARQFIDEHLRGHQVTLKLEPLQTRDSRGRLLAWVYIGDTECLNVNLVRAGLARAEARFASTLRGPLEAANADARRHHRGLWAAGGSRATATNAASR
jgi:endonuclease YncB( thermonuclease family)